MRLGGCQVFDLRPPISPISLVTPGRRLNIYVKQREHLPDVVKPGPKFSVRFATDASGSQPARLYLETAAANERAQILRRCERLAAVGQIPNREHFRQVLGPVFEVKGHQARVSCYRRGDVWYLLHGFTKKKDLWPPQELERALRIMKEHLARPG